MNPFTPDPAGEDQPQGDAGSNQHSATEKSRGETSTTGPAIRSPHQADTRSKRSRPARPRPGRNEETWDLDEEMKPELVTPKERWLEERERNKRRDRRNLTVLLVLIGYLTTCGLVTAWLLVRGVDQQTIDMFLQVFVVSLIPVIVLLARGFHR